MLQAIMRTPQVKKFFFWANEMIEKVQYPQLRSTLTLSKLKIVRSYNDGQFLYPIPKGICSSNIFPDE